MRQAAGPIHPGADVFQIFKVPGDYFSFVSLPIATYWQKINCKLSFSLYRLTGPLGAAPDIEEVVAQTENAEVMPENADFDLYFSPIENSIDQIFMLKIHSPDAVWGNVATVWLADDQDRIPGHLACLYQGQLKGDFGLVAKLGYAPPVLSSLVPRRLLYSPVTQCNLNCIHCISRETRKEAHRLDSKVRSEIADLCKNGLIDVIYTDYSGDLLWADHRWPGELDFIIDLDVPYAMVTNGIYLDIHRAKKLVNSKITMLNVSLDAARTETYNTIRKGSPALDMVLNNIRSFQKTRRELNAENRIALFLGFTLMRSNLFELEEFIEIAAELEVDVIACRHVEAYTPDMAQESLWFDPGAFNVARIAALDLAKRLGVGIAIPDAFESRPSRSGHRPCFEPWSAAVVLGNGDVQVCCLPGTKVGSLRELSLEDIWASKPYAEFRLAVNSDHPPAPCQACPYTRRLGNRGSYLIYESLSDCTLPTYEAEIDPMREQFFDDSLDSNLPKRPIIVVSTRSCGLKISLPSASGSNLTFESWLGFSLGGLCASLPMRPGISLTVTPLDRVVSCGVVNDRNAPYKCVWRAEIVLLSADGGGTHEIMRQCARHENRRRASGVGRSALLRKGLTVCCATRRAPSVPSHLARTSPRALPL